ncbi:MAG: MogA/MoaB family molybdenum cofactor biosynthesis protein [Armatimonadetes bacterium]|nr:MogA/MoaB family molybdenum cofactor biosynthesis protein [Armatimonadota bacterium]
MVKVGILTLSDRCSRGETEDISGKRIQERLPSDEFEVVVYAILPDEVEAIRVTLRDWAARCDAVITTGGTGLGPRDLTPEATRSVLDRDCAGIVETIRAYGYPKTPRAILSRGVSGIIGTCLVVNLPGSPKGVDDGMDVLVPILSHAVEMIKTGGPH